MARVKSPKYPNFPLSKAVDYVRMVYDADRVAPLPREVIAKHLGYSGLSGASDGTIATLGQYGLLDRVGKGEMKVSRLAVDILLPEDDGQKQSAINTAALLPPLFKDIWEHFGGHVPSTDALRTYLLRRDFHDRAIDPVMRSFEPTVAMMKQQIENESGGTHSPETTGSDSPNDETTFGGASVGDLIQWESQGALQFESPRRVRAVSEDGQWVAVEGSETGIMMSQVIVEQTAPPAPPKFALDQPPVHEANASGFSEWFRAKVGPDKLVTINFKGDGEIGPREIQKMIVILEAQKMALED